MPLRTSCACRRSGPTSRATSWTSSLRRSGSTSPGPTRCSTPASRSATPCCPGGHRADRRRTTPARRRIDQPSARRGRRRRLAVRAVADRVDAPRPPLRSISRSPGAGARDSWNSLVTGGGDPTTDLPLIVGADLNAVPDTDEVRVATGTHGGRRRDRVLRRLGAGGRWTRPHLAPGLPVFGGHGLARSAARLPARVVAAPEAGRQPDPCMDGRARRHRRPVGQRSPRRRGRPRHPRLSVT